jgi:O-methyltransferase
MTTFQYINLLLLNAAAWGLFGYFWSFWTFKVFKPFRWLDGVKNKRHSRVVLRLERKFKDKNRFYSLWLLMNRIEDEGVEGAMAELGVYKGETAKLLHHMAPYRDLFLFDSFDGLPRQVIKEDCDGVVRTRSVDFSDTTPAEVAKYIDGNSKVKIISGIFPHTVNEVPDVKYAFVHIDADLYQSTLDALNYFYPRLSPGGCIVVHDYNHDWEGVVKAVDEFGATIAESFVPIADMYGSVVLVKNKKI